MKRDLFRHLFKDFALSNQISLSIIKKTFFGRYFIHLDYGLLFKAKLTNTLASIILGIQINMKIAEQLIFMKRNLFSYHDSTVHLAN